MPLAPPAFAYAPVSLRRVLERQDAPGPRRLFTAWALAVVAAVLGALALHAFGAVPLEVGGARVEAAPYLPLACCVPLALWFGFWWGAVPAFAAGLALALAGDVGPAWTLVVACADPAGLGVLVLAYEAAPAATTLRRPAAAGFFAAAAFVSVLTSSAGAFALAYAGGLGPAETLAVWEGWWVGRFLVAALVCAPALALAGPSVERWKRAAGLDPHRPPTLPPGRMALAFSVVFAALAGYVLLAQYFGWLQLHEALGDPLRAGPLAALAALSALEWITFLFIGLAGYLGYQMALGWNRTAAALEEANAKMRAALAERELAQARLVAFAVEQEQANRSKDTFFSILSHDLRGPMGALLGLAQVAESRLASGPADAHDDRELVELAGVMHRSAENLYGLLVNLLEWSRLQTGQMRCRPEPVDLHALARATVELLGPPAAEKGVRLVNALTPGTTAWADPTMLRSVLLNLVSNGLKFTPSGGRVVVRADAEADSAGDRLALSVEDTGVGMAPADVARLFRLDTARSRTGTAGERGSGLGLLLCREMVERHGGTLAVASAPGRGSLFRFTLPLAPEPELDKAEAGVLVAG